MLILSNSGRMTVMSNLEHFTYYVSMMMKCQILGQDLVEAIEEGEVDAMEIAVMMMTMAGDSVAEITMAGWETSGSQKIMMEQNVSRMAIMTTIAVLPPHREAVEMDIFIVLASLVTKGEDGRQ